MPHVSIIVPAYNEKVSIVATLSEIRQETHGLDAEIIVVDDGSSDGTSSLAKAHADKVICHQRNRGKGAAMRTGAESAAGDVLVFIDADLTYPAMYISEIVDALGTCDVVFTHRTSRASMPGLNRFGNWLITKAIKKLTGFTGSDPLSGLYGLRRSALEAIDMQSTTFAIETEIVVKVSRMRLRAGEVDIAYRPRVGSSKLRPFRDGIRILKVLIDLLFIFRPSLTFGLPGGIGLAIGLVVCGTTLLLPSATIFGIQPALNTFVTGIALMLTGINIIAYGVIIDLYAVRNRLKRLSRVTGLLLKPLLWDRIRNLSLLITGAGAATALVYVTCWARSGFGEFQNAKGWMLSLAGVFMGIQGVFTSIIGRIFAKECEPIATDAINMDNSR